jgi:GT2 family glycosyltransferase
MDDEGGTGPRDRSLVNGAIRDAAGSPVSVSIVIISKDEPALADTLAALAADPGAALAQVVVVDASDGRLDAVRLGFPDVRWIDFDRAATGARVTIPHQRNAGIAAADGEVVVFIDAGCVPQEGWFSALLEPLLDGTENIVCGSVRYMADEIYAAHGLDASDRYLAECPTINLAFRRVVAEKTGPFDERFEYGSDVDFTWRAVSAGFKIRFVPAAAISHDWGGFRRQLKRSHQYGVARARLYRKHVRRLPRLLKHDSVALMYPLFILGLPLTFKYRGYPLLLAIPAWRNRRHRPLLTLVDHLVYGLGVLSELARMLGGAVQSSRSSSR